MIKEIFLIKSIKKSHKSHSVSKRLKSCDVCKNQAYTTRTMEYKELISTKKSYETLVLGQLI